jgi:hypothetical protein
MELSDSTKQAFSESISEDGPGEKKRLGHASDVMSAIKSDHELSKMAAQIKDLWAKWNEAEKSSVAGADLSPTAIRFREQMYGVVVKLKKLLTNKYIITHEVWADVKLVESYHYRLTDKETLEDAEEFLRIMNESVDRIRESDEDNLVLNAKEYASFANDYGKIFDMFRSINFMLAHALARVHGDKPRTKAINKIMDDVHKRMKDLEKWYEVFNATIQEAAPKIGMGEDGPDHKFLQKRHDKADPDHPAAKMSYEAPTGHGHEINQRDSIENSLDKSHGAGWFDKMGKEAQKYYLDAHPQSKFAKGESNTTSTGKASVTEEDGRVSQVSHHDFDNVMKDVMSGKSMFWVLTHMKRTPITAKAIKKFASSGYTLLSKDKDGKGYRLQSGKSRLYVFDNQLWQSPASYG